MALLTAAFFYSGSAAFSRRPATSYGPAPAADAAGKSAAPEKVGPAGSLVGLDLSSLLRATDPLVGFFQEAPVAPVATYAGDCVTPKTTFNYGDTVCAKVTGVGTSFGRRVAWVDPSGFIRQNGASSYTLLTTDPQSESFVLPLTDTTAIGLFTNDNRGTWKVNVVTNRGSVHLSVPFVVQGPSPTVDLSVSAGLTGTSTSAGQPVTFIVAVTNQGPNSAANVQLTNATPAGATFQSIAQTAGPAFSCTGTDPVVCTVASLPNGSTAIFEITYLAGGAGSNLTDTAVVTSSTTELNAENNTTDTATLRVGSGGGASSCVLECPGDIIIGANTTVDGNRGRMVTFGVEPFGSCGAVTSTPASGTFFPVGETTVNTSSAQGGGGCSFIVTVYEPTAPVMACPANQTVNVATGETSAVVNTGSPDVTGHDVEVVGVRSDSLALTDPYPVGTTTITWTATDVDNLTATCEQTIIVTESNTPAPVISCPTDQIVAASAGECEATVTLVTPTATPEGVNVSGQRSDGKPLTAAYPAGTTSITWTATDSIGRTDSCVQNITVETNDTVDPQITAPADRLESTNACAFVYEDLAVLGSPTASDNCSEVIVTVEGLPDGNAFPVGTTVLTYTATDAAGNTASDTQTITVKENPEIAPTITAPADVTANANEACAATGVALGTPTAADNCAVASVTNDAPASFPLGDTTVTWTVTDTNGKTATDTQTVTVVDNTAPTITAPATVTANADAGSCSATGVALGSPITADNCAVASVTNDAPASFPLGNTTVTWTVTDTSGKTATDTQTVTVVDTQNPTIAPPANVTVNADPLACSASGVALGTPTVADNCSVAGVTNNAPATYPVGVTNVIWTVTDGSGNPATATQTVTVLNPSPVVTITGPASGFIAAINTPVSFTGQFTDAGGGTHTATWSFDAATQAGTLTEPSGATPGSVTATRSFTTPGVYFVSLTVNDSCGATGSANQVGGLDAIVVIYDPNGGFATGGGWINSPAGAYAPNAALTGKANFGFVSKYHNGATVPTGQTEFQFKAGSVNFSSSSYEWLVIAGAKAKYKGVGTINGSGNYGFMLSAIDGQATGGGGTDKFRIKIWDKNNGDAVVYDNQMGAGIDDDPTTALGGGNIVVHKSN